MNQVKEALKILIKGENDAVALYGQFLDKANSEGYKNIATLFEALIMAERIHIKNHYNALGEEFLPDQSEQIQIGSTLENLKTALTGEIEENKNLYPQLIKSIKKECNTDYGKVAKLSMTWAKVVEKEHAKLLKAAYKSLKLGNDISFDNISICQVCGNVVINKIADKECTVCGHDHIFFKTINQGAQ